MGRWPSSLPTSATTSTSTTTTTSTTWAPPLHEIVHGPTSTMRPTTTTAPTRRRRRMYVRTMSMRMNLTCNQLVHENQKQKDWSNQNRTKLKWTLSMWHEIVIFMYILMYI